MSLNKAKKNKNKVKLYHSVPDRILTGSVWALLLIIMVAILVPLMFVLASSFSDPSAVSAGKVLLWPVDFSLVGYQAIFQSPSILRGFINSVEYTLVGTVISVTLTLFAAYPLSRVDLKIRGPVMFLFTVTMFFSGGMIPTYLVVSKLHLINTIWAMVLPGAMGVWNVILTKTYIQTSIPDEIYESASIDGCSDWRYFVNMVIPLSKPILATLTLFYAVGRWNTYSDAMFYIKQNVSLRPLQLKLYYLIVAATESIQGSVNDVNMSTITDPEILKAACIVFATIPIICVYPFVQKYFVQGTMIGAVKG